MDYLTNIRKYKVLGISVFDTVSSFVAAYFCARYIGMPIERAFLLTIPVSIIAHILVNVDTPMTKMFLHPNDYIPFKILVLFLLFKGLYYTPIFTVSEQTNTITINQNNTTANNIDGLMNKPFESPKPAASTSTTATPTAETTPKQSGGEHTPRDDDNYRSRDDYKSRDSDHRPSSRDDDYHRSRDDDYHRSSSRDDDYHRSSSRDDDYRSSSRDDDYHRSSSRDDDYNKSSSDRK